MRARFAFAVLLTAALCVSARAQELDIYEIDDFIDPRDLGATTDSRGRLTCPCDTFLVSRVIAGGATNYIDVLRPTSTGASFVHIATSYYRGPWQANWKLTRLNREEFGEQPPLRENTRPLTPTPEYKNAVQVARYFAIGPAASPSIIRMEATWTRIRYPNSVRDPRTGEIRFGHRDENEIGFEGDIPWRAGRFPFITSLVYVGRFKSTDVDNVEAHRRVTLLQRAPRITLGRWALNSAVAFGSVNAAGDWSDLMVQPSLHVVSPPIPRLNLRVNIRYAPAFGGLRPPPRGESRRSDDTNQIAIFIDRAVFAKRFASPTR